MGDILNWLDLAIDGTCWAAWSAAMAWQGARRSAERLGRDSWITGLRAWEGSGRTWVRLGVRRWRRLVPDARRCFGAPPAAEVERHPAGGWLAMAAETRRAERVHWRIAAVLPLFVVWNRGILLAGMVAYALVANAPCIILQRHNRARLLAVARREAAAAQR